MAIIIPPPTPPVMTAMTSPWSAAQAPPKSPASPAPAASIAGAGVDSLTAAGRAALVRPDNPASPDHRLYRRLQAVDDRDVGRHPAADGVSETVRRPQVCRADAGRRVKGVARVCGRRGRFWRDYRHDQQKGGLYGPPFAVSSIRSNATGNGPLRLFRSAGCSFGASPASAFCLASRSSPVS